MSNPFTHNDPNDPYSDRDKNFTIDDLNLLLKKLPPPSKQKAFVVKPSVAAKLKSEVNLEGSVQSIIHASANGLPFFIKQDQRMDCWVFENDTLLQRYLKGEITEIELIELAIKTVDV